MIFSLRSKQGNSVAILAIILKKLRISVSYFTIKNDLEEHPDYPSLLALSDCLSTWKVPNAAFRIDKSDYSSSHLSFPFIAHYAEDKFVVVSDISNGKVRYSDEEVTDITIDESEFLNLWDGVILFAEKDIDSRELDYRNALLKGWLDLARVPFLVLIIVACTLLTINYYTANFAYLGILTLNFIGIGISVLLLAHSIDASNPFIQNLCSFGKKNNCNAILKSEAAKVTSWLTWSEVGLFYFSGSFLSLLINPSSFSVLFWLNLACLPYTFYSIGYQIKIKNWCILCCSVQVLLWLEAVVFILNGTVSNYIHNTSLVSSTLSMLLLCFLVPVTLWASLKPYIVKSIQSKPLKRQLKKFKYNSSLFNQWLSSQPYYPLPDDVMPITLGNPKATTVLIMVSNPFCGPCATTHKMLDEWLKVRDDLQLKIVFTSDDNDNEDRTKFSRHVSSLGLLNNEKTIENALNDWYGLKTKKYENWALKYPLSIDSELDYVTKRQKAWCESVKIIGTPTIFVNGYQLTSPYRLEDIKYLLD